MEHDVMRRAAALDRYWDAVLRGDTASADTADIDAGNAEILDDLQALGSQALLVPDLERGWRELLQRPELHNLQGERPRDRRRTRHDAKETTLVQTRALPNVRPPIGMNGRADMLPEQGPSFRLNSRRHWVVSQVATAALLAMILVAGLVAFGGWRPGSFTPSRGHYLAAFEATPQPAHFAFLWKSTGGPDALSRPFGLGIDPTGNVWVADADNDRFQIFSPDGTYLETWGTPGSGEGEFEFYSQDSKYGTPYGGVAFDHDGNIYVLDTGNYRVQKFAPDRSFLLSWGTRGRDDGQFLGAIGIAVDRNGFVYVADETRADIQKFNLDGRFLTKFGGPTTDEGEIRVPGGPAVGPDGDVWVSDFSTDHIVRFSPDGTLRTSWGRTGNDEGELISPDGIAVDGMGRIYVADDGNNRLQVFTADGQFLAGLDRPADDQPKFSDMVTVAVGNDGVVYVSDQIGVYAFRIFLSGQPG
jgi:DNA-binding beta-propeller fold protein YncE